jgi:class 3 adenylate cyclase/CHASE2 domain-containing sensor protein
VHFKRPKRAPVLLALGVLTLVIGTRLWNPEFAERLENITYDLRVRSAQPFPAPTATNLAFVAMEDSSIAAIKNGLLGQSYGLYWPRHVYGRIVEELAAQGAKAIAFDIIFGELRTDHASVQMAANQEPMESDDFFAVQMRLAKNVLIAATPEITPPRLFLTNALASGDISATKDADGILRRVRAFTMVRRWHPKIENAAQKKGVTLTNLVVMSDKILMPQANGEPTEIPLDENGNISIKNKKNPAASPTKEKPFVDERLWHMGIVLAAQELKLDLAKAEVDLPHGKIILRGPNGLERKIPVDVDGKFYVDWRLPPNDVRLLRAPIEKILTQDIARLKGETNDLANDFGGKLVVIGSAAQGNDLTDRGATSLENDTLLVSKHWNVANSVITGQFIHRASLPLELAMIILLGAITALLTWELRAFAATAGTLLLVGAYTALAFLLFEKFRFWLPLVYPVAGAILVEHVCLVTYRVIFEERAKRHVKSIFSKMLSPDVVNELLDAKKLALGGARCEVTVFFADVRGFTALTDEMQEQVAEFVRTKELSGAAAEKCYDESARETLETVNLYLAAVAEAIKNNGGTLDKYIGDCVMAFWNAPTPNAKHALACVQAAIGAQQAILNLNRQRLARNVAREIDNQSRVAAGLMPLPLHVALQLGTGVNTGAVTVGLMGSDDHGFNYTVFGREVNLASRLEGVSGSGRIIISDTTYKHLLRLAPELAATCTELFPVTPKGFREAVRIYEVPWREAEKL